MACLLHNITVRVSNWIQLVACAITLSYNICCDNVGLFNVSTIASDSVHFIQVKKATQKLHRENLGQVARRGQKAHKQEHAVEITDKVHPYVLFSSNYASMKEMP